MKNVVFYLTIILLSCITPMVKGQVVLFTYAYESGLDDPEPGAIGSPVFSIVGALTSPNFFTGPLPATCSGSTGLSRSHAGWNTGEAYRFTVDATGYTNLTFAYCTRTSNATVNNFLCRVSCDEGALWTTIVPSYVPTTTFLPVGGSIPALCDEAAILWIEIFKVNEPGAVGNNIRIDNVTLAGLAVLPIELVDFSADEKYGKVELNWTTASETNNEYFSIERSNNGVDFYEIGKMEAAGNSTKTTDYSFIDDNPLTGINYYRLHQVDFDGKSSNGPVKSLNFGSTSTLSLYPTVTTGEINVLMNDNRIQLVNARVEIYDMIGQFIKSIPYRENLQLDVNDLTNGTYFVRVTNDQLVFSGNFIKI